MPLVRPSRALATAAYPVRAANRWAEKVGTMTGWMSSSPFREVLARRVFIFVLAFCGVTATASSSAAQTSYVSTTESSNTGAGCTQGDPWAVFYKYYTFTINHRLSCPSGLVTLETQYLYATVQNACSGQGASQCNGGASVHVQDNGSYYSVNAMENHGVRGYEASEFVCNYYSNSSGGVTFYKVTAPSGCP